MDRVKYYVVIGLMSVDLLMVGCVKGSPPGDPSCLSCNDTRAVRIQTATKEIVDHVPGLGHPLHLQPEDWGTVLRRVNVRSLHMPLLGRSYPGSIEPAFSEDEVLYLAGSLSRAFEGVSPKEWVTFALSRIGESGLPQLTSGAWFVMNNELQLRLANYRVTVTMPAIRNEIWSYPLSVQPGIFYELVAGDHQTLITDDDSPSKPFRPTASHLAIDFAALTGHGAAVQGEPSPPVTPLEDTLRTLKRLHEEGLITDEDYMLKKRQLLDRL